MQLDRNLSSIFHLQTWFKLWDLVPKFVTLTILLQAVFGCKSAKGAIGLHLSFCDPGPPFLITIKIMFAVKHYLHYSHTIDNFQAPTFQPRSINLNEIWVYKEHLKASSTFAYLAMKQPAELQNHLHGDIYFK